VPIACAWDTEISSHRQLCGNGFQGLENNRDCHERIAVGSGYPTRRSAGAPAHVWSTDTLGMLSDFIIHPCVKYLLGS